ncbi:OmpA family protein [Paracoccus sp. (in: a-proteobacteria)]|uniref:OmpA family protein n=1 Tax=Paracoccus sp. TaxID=267 RepID=UPI0026E07F20|nr:OmpA family protein [Paracoccus sp. (in: a-proteobacteria)]MDO5647339.1 OmpA family protein [Paracoccus sp. (in: a-proteobacteria)]
MARYIPRTLANLIALGAAGGLCWWGAQIAADFIEDRSARDVTMALQLAGQDWVQVHSNGLRVHLSGIAPSEVDRFRAVTEAATVIDASRIRDNMTVASVAAMTPPEFKVELLRNDQGISLIGLVPAAMDRVAVLRRLGRDTAAPQVTDLLEAADYDIPPGWDAAMRFGMTAAQLAARAKISIAPGRVHVTALADSRAEKARLEDALRAALPDGVVLDTDISAPRPVIQPFTLRFVINDTEGAHFDACAADTDDARAQIIAAASDAGLGATPPCTLGLGVPSPDWGDAAAAAIRAMGELGAGAVTLSDADIALIADQSVDRARFDAVVAQLETNLPPVFTLHAELEQPVDAQAAPIEFIAVLSDTGTLSMRGRIADDRMREAVNSFARSRFDVAQTTLRSDDNVPGGWTVRVIAALEAMADLNIGSVQVTPDLVTLTGTSGDPDAPDRAATALARRLGAGARYDLAIRYDRRLDATLGLPNGDECVAQLNIIMSESEIGFEPSRSSIAGDPAPTLQQLAAVMTDCADFQIEAGGHTDSQGSAGFNADLSRSRAQAIVAAMGAAGINTANMTARGYGESQPIDTNDTPEGREANRRIEFRLLSQRPVNSAPLPAPVTLTGVTDQVADPAPTDAPEYGPPMPATDAPDLMHGPNLPAPMSGAGAVPATIGVPEEYQQPDDTLDGDEEMLTVPVQTPDVETPRPAPRPDAADDAPQTDRAE